MVCWGDPYACLVSLGGEGVLPVRKESISVKPLICIHLFIYRFYGEASFFSSRIPLSLFLSLSLTLIWNINRHISYFGALIRFVWCTSSCKSLHTAGGYHHYYQSKYSPRHCNMPSSSHSALNYTSQTSLAGFKRWECMFGWCAVCKWTRAGVCQGTVCVRGLWASVKSCAFIFCSLLWHVTPACVWRLSSHSTLWSRAFSTVWALLHLPLKAAELASLFFPPFGWDETCGGRWGECGGEGVIEPHPETGWSTPQGR